MVGARCSGQESVRYECSIWPHGLLMTADSLAVAEDRETISGGDVEMN